MQVKRDGNSRIARNTALLYLRMFLVLAVSLYTTRVVLNVLGVIDYGVYNVVAGFVSMFSFLNTSMSHGTQRFYSYYFKDGEKQLVSVFNTAREIQFVLALILFVLLETIGLWYLNNHLVLPVERLSAAKWVFQFSVCSLLLVVFQVPYSAAIIANEDLDYFALVSIIDVLLKLGIVLALPYVPFDKLAFYGFLTLSVSLVNYLLYFIYSKKKYTFIKASLCFDWRLFKEMLSFSGWNIFDSFASMVKGQGVNILLNAFFGPIVNAARGVASNVMMAVQGFQTNLVTSFRPQLIQSYASEDLDRTRTLMYSMSKISFILLYIICVPIIIEIDFILNLWLKGVVPEYSVPFVILTLVNLVIGSLHTPLTQTMHATGKIQVFVIVRSIIVTSILPISWVFLKLGYNPSSVFWISLFATIFSVPAGLVLLRKEFYFSYREYIQNVIFPCLIVSIITPSLPIIIHVFVQQPVLRFFLVCVATIIGFCISFVFVFTSSEKKLILGFIQGLFRSHHSKL